MTSIRLLWAFFLAINGVTACAAEWTVIESADTDIHNVQAPQKKLFVNESFTQHDAVLVTHALSDEWIFAWQPNKPMIPASLTKLVTSYLAIEKWDLQHRFVTDFYRHEDALWVKGYGDPFITSEELDSIAAELRQIGVDDISAIHIDGSYFDVQTAPGRTKVADPYNAPLSAVAANFNTAKLRRHDGQVVSAELQTPLTPTASRIGSNIGDKPERVNLVNRLNAERNFAELLTIKLGLNNIAIETNLKVPKEAKLVYQHSNAHHLADVLRGTLAFSNNFIANQLFLMLPDSTVNNITSFESAASFTQKILGENFGWTGHSIVEGSGLSRDNRLTASQVNDVLVALEPNQGLLKKVDFQNSRLKRLNIKALAKTGTLNGVRSYAGFIHLPTGRYHFVFMFNRVVPWQYREKLLERLVLELL